MEPSKANSVLERYRLRIFYQNRVRLASELEQLVVIIYPPPFRILAQVSRRVAVRLKTGWPGA